MGTPSQGAQAKLAIDAATISGTSTAYELISESLGLSKGFIDHGDLTLRGSRSHAKERVSQDVDVVGGWLHFYPSCTEMSDLLQWIGFSASGTAYTLADSLTTRNTMVYRVAQAATYAGGLVNQAIFKFRKGERIKLSLDVWGTTETTGVTFPSITPDLDTSYTHQMGVLTLMGSTREFDQGSIVFNNHLQRQFNNSATAKLSSRDRTVYLACSTPYTSDETDLHTTPVSSSAGAAGSLVWTNGSQVTTVSFANLKSFVRSPSVKGKTEIRLPLKFKCFKSSTTPEVAITHVP